MSLSLGWLGVHAIHAHSLAWSPPFSYHSRAMLSRAQEARVRDVLASHPPGTIQTYCLEHLAAAVKIPPAHLADLAAFVRNLPGARRLPDPVRGLCNADAHETHRVLVWGPPTPMRRLLRWLRRWFGQAGREVAGGLPSQTEPHQGP